METELVLKSQEYLYGGILLKIFKEARGYSWSCFKEVSGKYITIYLSKGEYFRILFGHSNTLDLAIDQAKQAANAYLDKKASERGQFLQRGVENMIKAVERERRALLNYVRDSKK